MIKNLKVHCLVLVFYLPVLATAAAASFKFAWLSDTHVGSPTGEEDLRASVRDINSQTGLSFVLVSGDVTEYGSLEQLRLAKEILDGLKIPCHTIPGNHDTKWSESGATDFAKQEFSGFGTEFVLETRQSADWPIVVLQRLLAFNILLVHGRYGDPQPLDYWHRVPLGAPIVPGSPLTHLLIAPPETYEAQFSLASGKVDLLHVVGTTEREREYAKTNGSPALLELLKSGGAFPITDPNRACLAS